MFNVKFCTVFDDKSEATTSISCPHYRVYRCKNGVISITTYNNMTDINGVERHVMSDDKNKELIGEKQSPSSYYHFCYIENASGKTVENIRGK